MLNQSYKCLKKTSHYFDSYSLKTLQKSDIESVRLWRNDQMDILRQNKKIDKDQQYSYFETEVWPELSMKNPSKILLGLYLNDDLIGYGGLVYISWKEKISEISFLLNTERKKNEIIYAKDFSIFLKILKKIAFKDLEIKKLYSETYEVRSFHISILEENDFIKTKIMDKKIKIKNKIYNSIIHECTFKHE